MDLHTIKKCYTGFIDETTHCMNQPERRLQSLQQDYKEKHIDVDHINIRQSIFFIVLRLIVLEVITAILLVIAYLFIFTPVTGGIVTNEMNSFILPVFILFVLIKTTTMIAIIIQWLSEYYEITIEEVIHKKGFIFKKEQRNTLDHIASVKIEQGVFGRIFNYGTLKLHNWATEKEFVMYLIHNPRRYHHILETLVTTADREKQIFREHIIEEDR